MIRPVDLLTEIPLLPPAERGGFGALETERGRLPLTGLDVTAELAGPLARLRIRQTFRNSLSQPLEATYIFPLPDRAGVTAFRMEVAGRVVEGDLKERGQARAEYDAAIRTGHRAAIAEEERSGTFSIRVGNIPPQEEVTVDLTLVGPLEISDGEATFRFPLVVAERYTPGIPLGGPNVGSGVADDTDQVPDASRISPPVLLPGFPNPVRLRIEVDLDPATLGAACTPAQLRTSLPSFVTDEGGKWRITVQPGERLNQDFLLRFPMAQESVRTVLLAAPAGSPEPRTFALMLVPPVASALAPAPPRDIVFLLDRSGSMGGWKMVAARRALGRMVDTLLDTDRFAVLAFDDKLESPFTTERSLTAGDNRRRWQTLEWLGKIEARGGTEMGPALMEGMRRLGPPVAGRERLLVVVTDGQVSGENQLLKQLTQAAGGAMPRIFTLGIDLAANAGFLRRLAGLSTGTCELVESEARLDEVMQRIHRLLGHPVLKDVRITALTGQIQDIAPALIPDLHAGRPVLLCGRIKFGETLRLRLSAQTPDGPWAEEVEAMPTEAGLLAATFGRARVRDLEDQHAAGRGAMTELQQEIVVTSLLCRVLSRFTAYVAVDRSEIVNAGGRQTEVVQPVEQTQSAEQSILSAMPAGMVLAKVCSSPLPMFRASEKTSRKMKAPPPSPRSPAPPPPSPNMPDDEFEGVLGQMEESVDSMMDDVDEDLADDVAPLPQSPPRGRSLKKSHPPTPKATPQTALFERIDALLTEAEEGQAAGDVAGWLRRLIDALDPLLPALAQADQTLATQVADIVRLAQAALTTVGTGSAIVPMDLLKTLTTLREQLAPSTAKPRKRWFFWA